MYLQLNNISKKYGNFNALKSVNMTFENGIYGLLGANGAGKTTLINILIGALNATDGEIFLDGTNIKSGSSGVMVGEKHPQPQCLC